MDTDVFRIFGQLTSDLGNFAKAAYSEKTHKTDILKAFPFLESESEAPDTFLV